MSVTFSPAIRGQFGDWEYYITTIKAADAVRNIKRPEELFEVAARALDSRMQRVLSNRVGPMVKFLNQDHRFYGPLIVAIKGGNPEFIPLELADANQLVPINAFDLGVLRFSGTEDYFVLDGQHRLASLDEAITEGNDRVKEDDISVVIVRHEDSDQGIVRSRRIFTNLNRNAKPTTKSENITMDEDDGYAIVTRNLVREHSLLQDRIWYKTRGLTPNGKDDDGAILANECFTTLETVYNCNKLLLKRMHNYTDEWERVRPDPDLLEELTDECEKFWSGLCEIDAIELVASGNKACSTYRPLDRETRGTGHLLFRPIGQEALAGAILNMLIEKQESFEAINQICKDSDRIDWTLASHPWNGLFFGERGMMSDNTKKRQDIGSNLIRYMLGVPWPNADPDLLKEYREVVYPRDPQSPEAMQLLLPDIVAIGAQH